MDYFPSLAAAAGVTPENKLPFDGRNIDEELGLGYVRVPTWLPCRLEIKRLHHRLDEMARRCCPIYRSFGVAYHWSVDQCEYATDIVFKRQADLAAIYGNLTRTAIHTVKPDNIATFRELVIIPQLALGSAV